MIKLRDVDCTTFFYETGVKQIICIGAGQMFSDMCLLWEADILDRICLVCDNAPQKDHVNINGHNVRVISTNTLGSMNIHSEKTAILITSMYCMDIYEQLNNILPDCSADCYVYTVMSLRIKEQNTEKLRQENIHTDLPAVIPKVIHYCWFGKNPIPEKNKRCIESWYKSCPDYEIKCWDENNYDITKNRYMQNAYKEHKLGFVPDYARLDIVYNEGGIYLDTDVYVYKSFDRLLTNEGFAGFQRNYWVGFGVAFGAAKKHQVIKALRDCYDSIDFYMPDGTLNLKASPYYQTIKLKEYGFICNNTEQKRCGFTIYPTDVFDPQGFPGGNIKITDNTLSVHHYDECWVDGSIRVKNLERYEQVRQMMEYLEDK